MANKEHVEIIKQGTATWNQWRSENPRIQPDLSNADLHATDLSGANLDETDLSNANLSRANLSRAALSSAKLVYADLGKADLTGANLCRADLTAARNVTQRQLSSTFADAYTNFPQGIAPPRVKSLGKSRKKWWQFWK